MPKNNVPYVQYSLEDTVRSIWAETDLLTKKRRLIEEVVENFRFKAKTASFKHSIQTATTHAKIDKILANIVLTGEGLSTVSW